MKFLQQVADYYINTGRDMSALTMVFPNKRAAMFMRKYLKERIRGVTFMPRMISITRFLRDFDDRTIGTQVELVFQLYNSYCKVLRRHGRAEQIPEFDKFIFWGLIVLSDFNDIDAYMVDADMLYKNLKDVKEIESNYLTPAQIEVAEQLWGKHAVEVDVKNFWKHVPSEPDPEKVAHKFLALWEVMGELYRQFQADLSERPIPLSYSGLQSRRACERICAMSDADFAGNRWAFIGFNVLPTSRVKIMQHLRRLGRAEFFWDTASPYISAEASKPETVRNSAARMVLRLQQMLPMPADFEPEEITHTPDIEVIAVPSNSGQTKVVDSILHQWMLDGTVRPQSPELIETAVVMPDDQLLMPLLHSIDPLIRPINVTMGVSYGGTPFATLMSSIIAMQMRARQIMGEYHYFYRDVQSVLAHPHLRLIAPAECLEITKMMADKRLYNISAAELSRRWPRLAFVFNAVDDPKDINQVRAYTLQMIGGMRDALCAGGDSSFHEIKVLEAYHEAVDVLCRLIGEYGVGMQEHTFFSLLERLLQRMPVNFSGMPLVGMQVMGVMDTRSLDFDNLIITSMNERVFPRRTYTPTMIPASLRSGYGMPGIEQEESTYAYQFYRLISRAKRVRLLFDSSVQSASAGERSRYVSQLQHLHPELGITERSVSFDTNFDDTRAIVVNKTPEVIATLRRFRPGGDLNLSPSALKTYINCPLQFYLQYCLRLSGDMEAVDYVDAATYGTVLHAVLEDLYKPYIDQLVDAAVINRMLASDIVGLTARILDHENYKDKYAGNIERMPGEGRVLSKIIARYVRLILEAERQREAFTFRRAEMRWKATPWRIDDRYTLNLSMSIDRVDSLDANHLRLIDYKTGSDETTAKSIGSLFVDHRYGAIFQVMLYARAHSDLTGYTGDYVPEIYKMVTIASSGLQPIKIGGEPLTSYRKYEAEFSELLSRLIDDIFEEENEMPFVQTDNHNNCGYCTFASMCGRTKASDK